MKIKTCTLCLLAFLVFWASSPQIHAEQMFFLEESSTDDVIYAGGIISSISMKKMQFTIRSSNGDRIVLNFTIDTQVEGTRRIEDLEKEHRVKVWYQVMDRRNTALKIEKLPDLGC